LSKYRVRKGWRPLRDKLLYSQLGAGICAKISFPFFRKRSGINPLVIYYHLVTDDDVPHVSNLHTVRSVAQFKMDLDVLLRFFRPIRLQDLLLSLDGMQTLRKGSFLLTFDDGFAECHHIIAPILNQKGVPATFLLCSGLVDNKELADDSKKSLLIEMIKNSDGRLRYKLIAALKEAGIAGSDPVAALLSVSYRRRNALDRIGELLSCDFRSYLSAVKPYLTTEQCVKLLKMGHALGAHSIDHAHYQELSFEEQVNQTRESIRFVRKRFSLDYGAFAFPYSDAGISKSFFEVVFEKSGEVDVCFGNRGLLGDTVLRNVQRTAMDKTRLSAEAILGMSYLRRFVKSVTGQLQIARP
jgi:peptidoglycan/xylan/chitin deacetylase (PgdA/CDA1 family)